MTYSFLNESDMKELNVLSSSNLGIVSKNSNSYLREDSKALIIGLGGMGQETVCRLKKTLTKNIGTLDPNRIQFLILDTAANELTDRLSESEIDETEFIKLHSDQLSTLFNSREFIPQEIKDIIKDDFRAKLDGRGANQVRLAGRLTASEPSVFRLISEKLNSCISSLREENRESLYIYVVSGVGGGTGSGLIVDISYLIRNICEEQGLRNTKIMGNVFLPNVHIGRSDLSLAYRNGYAALKEIDYYMAIKEIGEAYTTKFPNKIISSHENIFDRCTLIGGEVNDMSTENYRERALKTCVENLATLITKARSENTDVESTTNVFFVDSFINNDDSKLSVTFGNQSTNKFPQNANYVYCSVGVASMYFPKVPILEFLAGSVYNKMIEQLIENSTKLKQTDVDEFETALEIKPNTLIAPLLRKFENEIEVQIESYNIKKSDLVRITRDIEVACTTRVSNYHLENYERLVSNVTSICNSKANEIFESSAKGPYYLAKLIVSNSKTGGEIAGLFEKFRGYWSMAESIKSQAERNYTDKKARLKELISLMTTGRGGLLKGNPFKRNIDTYKETLKEICVHELERLLATTLMERYFRESEHMSGLNYELKKNFENNHLYFCDVVKYLDMVMADNVEKSKSKIFDVAATDNILGLPDPIFKNIKSRVTEDLRQEIKDYSGDRLSQFTVAFLHKIVDNKESWRMTEDNIKTETACVQSFRNFVKDSFGKYSTDSLSDYLELSYKTERDSEKNTLAHKIVEVLLNKSSLSYNIWDTTSLDLIPELNHNYIILPQNIGSWSDRFENAITNVRPLAKANNQIMYSPDENSLFCYNLYICLPLWLHSKIRDYEENYYKMMASGVHTNESAIMHPPYLEYPSLFVKEAWSHATKGTNVYTDAKEDEYRNKLKYAFDLGCNYGIIQQEGNRYVVNSSDIPGLPKPTFALVKTDGKNFEIQAPAEISSELQAFVQGYIADAANISNEDGCVLEDNIYTALCQKFGKTSKEIQSNHPQSGGLNADSETNAILLLRKQMQLTGNLLSMLSVLKAVHNLIKKENSKRTSKLWQENFHDFMLYGFITSENGKWYYFDIDKIDKINKVDKDDKINKTDNDNKTMLAAAQLVSIHDNPQIKILADYMELAAFKLFLELANHEKIHNGLKNEMKYIVEQIVSGNPAKITATDIIANCEKYKLTAEEVLDKYSDKVRRDNLTEDETTIVNFYKGLANKATTTLKLYS
ncbi:MAG: tubulin-like doman-containing protein [Defluviitaleaceae bacterium]|nr:tubulin-like doman-containing protein [Defluviitaleaceae bacterium]